MEPYTSVSKLAEMKKNARGNPRKIAEYNIAKVDYDAVVSTYFDNDANPFVAAGSDEYLAQLATASESGEPADMMRFAIAKDSAAGQEFAMNGVHEKTVTTISKVRGKLSEGQPISSADMTALESAVRQHSSPANVALFSQAKRAQSEVSDAESAD